MALLFSRTRSSATGPALTFKVLVLISALFGMTKPCTSTVAFWPAAMEAMVPVSVSACRRPAAAG